MEFMKYLKIKVLGADENKGILDSRVEITEKIDGFNARIMLKDKLVFGSRNRELAEVGEKQFTRFMVYIKELFNTKNLKDINKQYSTLILYGEGITRHTIGYDFDKMPPFIGYDIYSINENKFLDSITRQKIFKELGIEYVHVIDKGKFSVKHKFEVPQSVYYNGPAEGLVIKSEITNLRAKIVRAEFKEKNREVFGGSKKFAKNDTDYFVAVYCTNARIEKHIFKLLDEDETLDMKLMMYLPKSVYTDIWEEEWQEIYPANLTLDLKNIRKRIASRCKDVLLQMIDNNR